MCQPYIESATALSDSWPDKTRRYVTGHGKRDHFNKFLEIEFCIQ